MRRRCTGFFVCSKTAIGHLVCTDMGKSKNRPMANLPGPAIKMGANRSMRARLYSNHFAAKKNPFFPWTMPMSNLLPVLVEDTNR